MLRTGFAKWAVMTGVLVFGSCPGDLHGRESGVYANAREVGVTRRYAPSREIDILHQRLEVTPDFERRSLAGTMRIEFKPIAKAVEELRLDAVELAIKAVASSAEIRGWQSTGERLVVTFEEPVGVDAVSWVTVEWTVEEPAAGLYFRTPAMGYREGDTHLWTQGEMHEARHWYPCYDYPNEKFTTEMICHVAEGMVALSNGRLISRERDSGTGLVAWRWMQEWPHVNYLVTLCAGYFEKIEDRHGDVPLAFWAPASRIEFAKNAFEGTREMMAFFEAETGVRYPWARYDQVVVDDFTWGGMENTTQTTLNDRTLYPDAFGGTRSALGLVAHELAHQWFGNYVTCKDWGHVWLNEGFATYYESLYREQANGRDEFLYDTLENARRVLGEARGEIPMVYRGYDDPKEQFDVRAYPKGSWILHMLRSQLGPELYRECVRAYLQRHAYGVVTTDDWVKVLEERSGRDWDRFFDQYVYHAHYPELEVEWGWDERTRLARVSIRQVQELGPTVMLFDLPLKVRFQSGATLTDGMAHVRRAAEDYYFALPTRPEIVRIDPEYTWLAKVEFTLPQEMLFAQLSNSDDMIGRVLAIEQLAKQENPAVIERLRMALNGDSFWGVRLEAAKALRQIRRDEARDALVGSVRQEDVRVRREVLMGIAAYYGAKTRELVMKEIEGETNPDVQADLIRALGAYPVEEVRETLMEYLRSSSYGQVLAEAAMEAIRGQHHPAYLEALLETLKGREREFTTSGFAGGLEVLATIAADEDDKTVYREFLLGRLDHPKRSVQMGAIGALGTLGDPKAVAALRTFTLGRKDDPRVRAAAEAIGRLRAARGSSPELGVLRQEVLELQKQIRELRQQMEEALKKLDVLAPGAAEGDGGSGEVKQTER
jgi:aminopeptidase N